MHAFNFTNDGFIHDHLIVVTKDNNNQQKMFSYRRNNDTSGNFTLQQSANLGSAPVGDVAGDQNYLAVSFPTGINFRDGIVFRTDGIIEVYRTTDITKSIYTIKGSVNQRFIGEQMYFRQKHLSPTNLYAHEIFFLSRYETKDAVSGDNLGWSFKVGRTTMVQKTYTNDTLPVFFTDYDAFVSSSAPTRFENASFTIQGERIAFLKLYDKNFELSSMCSFDQYYTGSADQSNLYCKSCPYIAGNLRASNSLLVTKTSQQSQCYSCDQLNVMNNIYGDFFKDAYCTNNVVINPVNGGTSSNGATNSGSKTDNLKTSSGGSSSLGVIIGAAIGGIVVIAIIVYVTMYCCNSKDVDEDDEVGAKYLVNRDTSAKKK